MFCINIFLFYNCLYMLLVYLCIFSGMYLYFMILMYVKRHEQFEIGFDAILNKIYYYIVIFKINFAP